MFEKLFGNPGAALRVLGNIIFVLCVLGGTAIGFTDDSILLYLLGAAGGFIIGWLSGLVIHLFASIAENLYYINKNVYSIADITEKNNNK